MKISEVRAIVKGDPNAEFLVRNAMEWRSTLDLPTFEKGRLSPSGVWRVRLIDQTKYDPYLSNKWTMPYDPKNLAGSPMTTTSSARSFFYECEVLDHKTGQPTGFRVMVKYDDWFLQLTDDRKAKWLDTLDNIGAIEAEMKRRETIIANSYESSREQASKREKALRKGIEQVFVMLGVPLINTSKHSLSVNLRADNTYDQKHLDDLSKPFDESHISTIIRGQVSFDHQDIERLLEGLIELQEQ